MKKIVLRINVKGDSCRSKALMLASSMKGVESVAIRGKDRNHLVVTGNGVDPVDLVRALRKKRCYAEIIGVGRSSAEESLEGDDEPTYLTAASQAADQKTMLQHETGRAVQISESSSNAYGFTSSSYCNYPVQYSEVCCYRSGYGNGCSIM